MPGSSSSNRDNSRRGLAGLADIFGADHDGPAGGAASLAGAVVDSVFTAPKETVGIRLLRDMGWRPGQGIGPRLHKKAKARRKAAHARMFGEGKSETAKDDSGDEDEKYKEFLFAPDDIPSQVSKPKDNYFGIGKLLFCTGFLPPYRTWCLQFFRQLLKVKCNFFIAHKETRFEYFLT